MSIIYAMSDIHGYYEPFIESLDLITLKANPANKLVLTGDYVNIGPDSVKVLYKMNELNKRFPGQVIVLMGNHEEQFLNWLEHKDDEQALIIQKNELKTIESFLSNRLQITNEVNDKSQILMLKEAHSYINDIHTSLIEWLKKLPYYYETREQIFVHAGIMEEADELWKHGTPKEYFTHKFPAETGRFYKDIIAGHIGTSEIANDPKYIGKVYWDGASHYYIDGTTAQSGVVPVLKYDTETQVYSSFVKDHTDDWVEYDINKND